MGSDWEDALVTHGYIVVCVDPRGTGYRGEEFKKLTYGDLGRLEVEDQISTARYMARQSWSIQRESASTAGRTEVSWP